MCGVAQRVVGHRLFFFQAEDGIRDLIVTGVQTCALPIYIRAVAGRVFRLHDAGRRDAAAVLARQELVERLQPALAEVNREIYRRAREFSVQARSEERRVGEEGRSRWSPYHLKKKKQKVEI